MLATVTERTREIGIRRALGAKNHIIQQFLTETVLTTRVGCWVLFGVLCEPIFSTLNLWFLLSRPILPPIVYNIEPKLRCGVLLSLFIRWAPNLFACVPATANLDPVGMRGGPC